MEESTYKNLFPSDYAADEDTIPSPLVLNDPHKEYSLISRKLFQCNFSIAKGPGNPKVCGKQAEVDPRGSGGTLNLFRTLSI